MARDRKKVCVVHVGGTIGMVRTDDGLQPQPGFLADYLAHMPELQDAGLPETVVVPLEPLLDSAEMRPRDWTRIAQAIVERDADFDGFVVLHGTDTMTYTASALSFLLTGLQKPVVLTGAQLSLENPRTDGREHIITAVLVAGTMPIPEVCIYFGARLLRGNRAQKVNNNAFVAFSSGNAPPLATVGVAVTVREHFVRPPGSGLPREIKLDHEPLVAAARLFPGMRPEMLQAVLAPPTEGLVLETYGAGTFPASDERLLAPIREATGRTPPAIIVNCSQCHGGSVRQEAYAAGAALTAAGVLSGFDMTPEAALTKLYVLLGMGTPVAEVAQRMGTSVAGELSRPATGGA